jgi:hypothetical protein
MHLPSGPSMHRLLCSHIADHQNESQGCCSKAELGSDSLRQLS